MASVRIEDLPERVHKDFEKYLREESSEDERKKVVDDESARRFIAEVLPRKLGLQHYFPDQASPKDYALIIDGAYMQELIGKNKQDKVRLEAQRVENKRPLSARRRDEGVTARRTVPVTLANVRRWKRAPGRSDLKGVDTRLYTPKRTARWVRHVRARGEHQWYVYRNLRGQFIRNPEKRKK